MDNKVYNLDEGIVEYFEFKFKGNKYRFQQMTVEEIEQLQTIEKKDPKEAQAYLFKFISPVEADSPAFSDVARQMTSKHLVKFTEMIRTEFGG